jgi:hypothetical protein
MGEDKKGFPWLAVLTLGLAVVVKLGLALLGLRKADWNLEAPVTYRVLIWLTMAEAAAIGYLVVRLWVGMPAVLQ